MDVVFKTSEEAIKTLKLDRRHKREVWLGTLCYPHRFTIVCTGCDGGGCHECGYHGKSRSVVPVPAMDKDGNIVKIEEIILNK